jgi:tetratricopeptide (TPR) repeat protein
MAGECCRNFTSGVLLCRCAVRFHGRVKTSVFCGGRRLAFHLASALLATGFVPAQARPAADLERAIALYEDRQYSAARRVFLELAGGAKPGLEVNFYLGRLALWFDEGALALAHLEKGAIEAPDDARLQNALGDAYGMAAQNAPFLSKFEWARKCRAAYERAVQLDPRNPNYRWSLIGYYQLAPRLVGGGMEKAYAEAAEIRRLDAMIGRIAFATLFLAERRHAEAFALFDEVLSDHPDDFLALYHVGRCAAISGEELERGRLALGRCLELVPPRGDGMPTYSSVHFRLGNILEHQGEREAAAREYAAATAKNPDFRPAKMALKN